MTQQKKETEQIHLITHTKHIIPNKMKKRSAANIEAPKLKFKWWRGEIEDIDKPVPAAVTACLYFLSWTSPAAKTLGTKDEWTKAQKTWYNEFVESGLKTGFQWIKQYV